MRMELKKVELGIDGGVERSGFGLVVSRGACTNLSVCREQREGLTIGQSNRAPKPDRRADMTCDSALALLVPSWFPVAGFERRAADPLCLLTRVRFG